jgi:hypothetical protein
MATLRFIQLVGMPLMVQVVLSILKPAGSEGATVQLVIAPPELLKVMFAMAEPITKEVQMHPLVTTIPRSIQLLVPLPPLKPMGQSRRGVTHLLEVQVRPLIMATLRFIQNKS